MGVPGEPTTQVVKRALELRVLGVLTDRPAGGYELIRTLQRMGQHLEVEGSIYPLLSRLERRGLVHAHSQACPGGFPRKYYRITNEGRAMIGATTTERQSDSADRPCPPGRPVSLTLDASDAIDAIFEHWAKRGVEEAADMRLELTRHVEHALFDGKSVDDVTGPDLRSFADSWAAERVSEPRRVQWGGGAITVGAAALTVLGFVPLFAILDQGSFNVVIEPGDVAFVVAVVSIPVWLWRSRLTRGPRPMTKFWSFILNTISMVVWVSAVMLGFRLLALPSFQLQPAIALLALTPFGLGVLAAVWTLIFDGWTSLRVLLGLGELDLYEARFAREDEAAEPDHG